jgi:putative heme-binding domain-containing protein
LLRGHLRSDRSEVVALRDLWALNASGGFDDATALDLLDHPVPAVRRWSIRLLGDDSRINSALRAKLASLAATETEALTRSQLAASCQRWPSRDALPVLAALMCHDSDVGDPHLPSMIWWAVEWQLRNDKAAVIDLFCRPDVARTELATTFLLERVSRALSSGATDDDLEACARLLASAPGDAQTARIVAGMDMGLEGRQLDRVPPSLSRQLARLWSRANGAPGVVLVRLAARLGDKPATTLAVERSRNPLVAEPERIALIVLLGELARADLLPVLTAMLSPRESQPIQLAVVNALGHFHEPSLADRLLSRCTWAEPPVRDRIVGVLCARPVWALALLDAMARGEVSAKVLTSSHAQQVVQLHDPALLDRLERAWGKVPAAGSAQKRQRIAEVRGLLPEGDKGDVGRGKSVFQQNCAVCHKLFGDGEAIGPDLTGTERGNLEFLLASVVDPSSVIRKEFQAQTIALKDGRVLSGLIVDENDRSLTVLESNRQKTVVARETVEAVRSSGLSLMPEGLLEKLNEPQMSAPVDFLGKNPSLSVGEKRVLPVPM